MSDLDEATCIFCDRKGADTQIGRGEVIGVAAHFECWLNSDGGAA